MHEVVFRPRRHVQLLVALVVMSTYWFSACTGDSVDDLSDEVATAQARPLTLAALSPAAVERLDRERSIAGLGPEAHRLKNSLGSRSDSLITRQALESMFVYQFGNEAGLLEFLDQVGEPAFELAMYPGETLRDRIAVVPVVKAGSVPGYIYFSFGSDATDPAAAYVDFVRTFNLERRFAAPDAIHTREELGYLWALAGPKFQLDYWLFGKLDTATIGFLNRSDTLLARGVLGGRECRGISVSTCATIPTTFWVSEETCAECIGWRHHGVGATEWCSTTCQPTYDGPYIPGGTVSGEPGNLGGNRDPSSDPGVCRGEVVAGAPNQFPGGDLGGNSGPAPDERDTNVALEAAVERLERIMGRFEGLSGFGSMTSVAVAAAVYRNEDYAEVLEKALDKYGDAINCQGHAALGQIAGAAYQATLWGGCEEAMRRALERLDDDMYIDYAGLDACPKLKCVLDALQASSGDCYQATFGRFEGPSMSLLDFKFSGRAFPGNSAAIMTTQRNPDGSITIEYGRHACDDVQPLEQAHALLHEAFHASLH